MSLDICWSPTWAKGFTHGGFEHVIVRGQVADSSLLAVDEDGAPFRMSYRLQWDDSFCLREANIAVHARDHTRELHLLADGEGTWQDAGRAPMPELNGCIDLDIWPTPFTNSFPIWRSKLRIGERREFRMAWVNAPALTIVPKQQAYTRLGERRYLFESLDGSGFRAELPLDDDGVVLDYPDLFRRAAHPCAHDHS